MDLETRFNFFKLNKECFISILQNKFNFTVYQARFFYTNYIERSVSYDDFLSVGRMSMDCKLGILKQSIQEPIANKTIDREIKPVDIIVNCFIGTKVLHLSEIYERFARQVGGSHINPNTLASYVDKNNLPLSIQEAKKRQEGFIRSTLEEHSADSRQYYVKNNKFHRGGVGVNLFSNLDLRKINTLIDWKIKTSSECRLILQENNVSKSGGYWCLHPSNVRLTSTQIENIENELIQRPKGCRNQQNTFFIEDYKLSSHLSAIKI